MYNGESIIKYDAEGRILEMECLLWINNNVLSFLKENKENIDAITSGLNFLVAARAAATTEKKEKTLDKKSKVNSESNSNQNQKPNA